MKVSFLESESAKNICKILVSNGKNCYVAGGAVRDYLLGKEASDLDFITDATPWEIVEIFSREKCHIVPKEAVEIVKQGKKEEVVTLKGTGAEFGVIRVRCDGDDDHHEITTYRVEKKYEGRKPTDLQFTTSLIEDLARRDFTINAIAYDPLKEEIVDAYGGREDLKNRLIRAIGNPEDRFTEDPLRLMRACRFKAVLNGEIEEKTFEAMKKTASRIDTVSKERIFEELIKLMKKSEKPSVGIKCLDDAGILERILPELTAGKGIPQPRKYHKYDVFNHSLAAMDMIPKERPLLRFVTLLHDIGKPPVYKEREEIIKENPDTPYFPGHEKVGGDMMREIATRLKTSKKFREWSYWLVSKHMTFPMYSDLIKKDSWIRKWINRHKSSDNRDVMMSDFEDLFQLNIADTVGTGMPRENDVEAIKIMREKVRKELFSPRPITMKDMPINGHDIMAMGVPAGPEVGKVMKQLFDTYLKNPKMSREELLREARRLA